MDKLNKEYQDKFINRQIYDNSIFDDIDSNVDLHDQTKVNSLSSSASCLNVLGSMRFNPEMLMKYLNQFGLSIEKLYPFSTGCTVGGKTYNDKGYVIFEWVGPNVSPINELGSTRGKNRTSIDAYIIALIEGKITQLLIEWKFTEGKSRPITLEKFSGLAGLERVRRYSAILTKYRNKVNFPFIFLNEGDLGILDFSADHFYQLLRMTLLAKTTTPIQVGEYNIQDYRIIHLSHSKNQEMRFLQEKYLEFCPGLRKYSGDEFHQVWKELLTTYERGKFASGYWDTAIKAIDHLDLKAYLSERYLES